MKAKSIQMVTEDLINQDLFGVKYAINSQGVNISTFTPIFISDETHQSTHLRGQILNDRMFQVSLLAPFFLPLQSSLNGLCEECLFLLSQMMKNNESINVIWLFQKSTNWKESAINMYESYLEGNDSPSYIPILRTAQDRLYSLFVKVSPQLTRREYSQDVEDKILDEGYKFQCMIEVHTDRVDVFSHILQEIFMQYDYHNGLRIEEIDYQYPYTFYPTMNLLSKKEIMSLLNQSNAEIEISENPLAETIKKSNKWQDRIKLLPKIENKTIKQDDEIVTKLAEALKRVGLISKAQLYNESIEYGARLIVVHSSVPKNKNFSDIEKKRKDIQVALGVSSLSIEQGDNPGTIKFSIPHNQEQIISLREIIERDDFAKYQKDNPLSFIVGLDEIGNPVYLSLRSLRHLLVAGTSGSGKSVFVNQLLSTLLITNSPEELNLLLIDPKQVELQLFEDFPHVQKVVTNMSESQGYLDGLVEEMERRYGLFKNNKVKDIDGYNSKSNKKLPYLVCVIEEYADLRDEIGKDIEEPIMRLGQKARAAGIHLILITQRPSSKILNSDIQANLVNAISFNLGSNSNYKTVFGKGIPFDSLMGNGDGVMKIESYPKEFQRFQGCMVAKSDVEESLVLDTIAQTYDDVDVEIIEPKEDSVLDRLKRIIATTKETRVSVLRDELGIKSEVMTTLMDRLINEGWIIRHKSKAKGYELIADENILSEWRE